MVPWAVSCGTCARCRRGPTSRCEITTRGILAAFGFGPIGGPWGGMVADTLCVPYADPMLVPVPAEVPPERVAAAGDNLADAWRSVVAPVHERPGARVLIVGGGARSIAHYSAGLAVAHGAGEVDYVDEDPRRRAIADAFGARSLLKPSGAYDIAVEASSRAAGLRLAPARTRARRHLHRSRRLPGVRHPRAAHADVCRGRDPAPRRIPRARRLARPARLHRAHGVSGQTRHNAHRRLGRRPVRRHGQDHQARPQARPGLPTVGYPRLADLA